MQKLLQLGLPTGQLNKAIAIALNGPSKEECGFETQARHIWSWTNTWWHGTMDPQSPQLPEVKALSVAIATLRYYMRTVQRCSFPSFLQDNQSLSLKRGTVRPSTLPEPELASA